MSLVRRNDKEVIADANSRGNEPAVFDSSRFIPNGGTAFNIQGKIFPVIGTQTKTQFIHGRFRIIPVLHPRFVIIVKSKRTEEIVIVYTEVVPGKKIS